MNGYWNKVLRVNLTERKWSEESIKEELLRQFIGGSGLGAKLLYDEVSADVDPLGSENKIFFITGPFCGTIIPTSGRHAAVTKSPLTGIFAESDIGGFWGFELKKAGFDGVIIEGKSRSPVIVSISDSNIEIRGAEYLWGKDTVETDSILKESFSPHVQVMSIGPAGENLVKYASIITDGKHGRALGRCGIGAVMGSKKLKAIVVKGSKEITIFDSSSLTKSIKSMVDGVKKATLALNKFGTSGGVIGHESYGNFPLKNWLMGRWPEGAEKISGPKMAETILIGKYRCKTCIIGCGRKVRIEKGQYKGVDGAGPEYETIGTLGGMCLIDNLEAIAYGSQLCNRYGMDTISTGSVIAFIMELFEKGIITKADTGGIEANFGNEQAMIELIKLIAERKGIGRILGEGVRKIAEEIGGMSIEYAFHVKGLEIPAHDPRAFNGLALSYATSNRGACHLAGFTHGYEKAFVMPEFGYEKPHDRHLIAGKAEFVVKMQNLMGIFDSIKLCKLMLVGGGLRLSTIVDWVSHVVGWEDYSLDELMTTGERIFNIKRLFNVKCGISRKDDILPMRFLTRKREGPDVVVNLPHLGLLLSDYYTYRGWSEEGIPEQSRLAELNLT
ncbi:MAG: putative oxidoreductase YdhV [Chloroflexi bacterium]|nr:putative oxidoreductase YdhV [Chloroflexota bacterium]